jgi:hypothetical protein
MSTTDILDLVKKVKSEMPAGAFSPVEGKSLVYGQQQDGETVDPSSLTPEARDVLRLVGKIKQGSTGIDSGVAGNLAGSQGNLKYDSREQAIIDRNIASSANDKLAGEAAGDMEVQQRRQQRAYAEQAPPEVAAQVKELLSSSGDRNKVLDIVRNMTPEQREETLRLAPGIAQQLGDDRGGAIGRTLGALSLGVSKGVSQPLMELVGAGGTKEEIEYIRKLDALASQEFAPARPGDPWYEAGPLQAAQMAPWMATVVGAGGLGRAAGQGAGTLLARGAAAGVPGAKAAFQAAGAVGRVPTAIGLKGATTKGVFQGAGTLAGITSAAFPGQYAQEVDQLKEIGMEDDWKLRLLAGGTATVAGLVEGIVPNPFGGTVSLKQGAMKAARQYLWEALKKAPPELGEEYLQGVTSGLGQHVAQYIDKDAKEKTIADAFANGWEQTKEAALPMAFLLGVPAVGGAGLSAIRARRYQLEQIRAKNFVSESDAKAAGIEGNSRRERMANVESEIEQLGQQEAEASKQLDQEFINQQQQGGQAQRLPSSAELQAELDAIRLKTSSTEKVKLADGTAIPGRQARYLTWEERQRYKTLPGLIEEAKQREAAQGDPAIPLQAPQPQVGVQPEQTVAGSQIDEAGELVPQASQADLDREFFERMAARGGNVSTPSGDIVLPSPVTLPSQPVAGQPSVPQQTPASFAARMARGEQMTSPEDQQYRINNAAEIEAELQKLMSPTDTATAPPAEQPPVQPLTDKEFFDQQAGGNVATPEVPPVTPTAGDPFGEAAPPAEDPREQPEEKEASAQSKVSDDTYKKIREVLRPANREDLQLAVPYLRVLYPEYASDLNDPWGIGRAVQQGSELPRVPTADLSRRIRDAISLGVLSEAGDVISQEPSALTPEQQIQSDREFADRKAAAEINGKTVEQMRNEGMSEDEIQEEESKQNYFNVIGDVTKASDKDLNRAYGFSGRLVDYHERKGQSDMAESVRREQESMKAEIKRRNAQEDQQPDQPVPPSDIASAESDMDAAMREEFKKQLGEKDDKQPPKKRPPRKDGKSKKPSSLKKSKGKARKEADNLWDELIKKSQNKLLTGLDPELLTLAARIAIKELEYSAISFAEFVERSVAKVPDTLLEKLKPYLESAWRTAYDSEMTTDAGGKFDDYIKKPEKSRPKTDELQGELRIPVAGQPFTFTALHNKEKSPDMGSRFGQDKEPAGRYVVAISDSNTAAADMPDKFDRRTVTFQNPLVIEFGGGYQEASNWKQVLSGRYGGLTGKALSQAIVDDGFDGIVTVEPAKGTNRPAHTSEIVDLSTIKAEGKPAKPTPAEVVFGEITDGRKPDLQIAAVAANNQYGIWAKIGTRWRFIGNAGANREQAIAKAKERAESIARGETTGVAFIGSELLAVKPKLIQVLENTLDPEQLVSAEKIAIGDQPVGFGKHANKTVKDLIEQEPGYVSWLIENATTPRAKQIVSYLLERPEFAAKIEQENQDVSNLVDEKATKLLAKFGLRANASNGRIYIRGETYEWKDQIRNAGGRWNKGDEAWSLTAEGFEKLQEELRGLPVPDDATGGRLPAYLKDTELRRLREDVDGRPDSRKSSEVVAGLVGQDTKDLISQGLKIGMPQRVVDEQIEDVGSIVDAYKENKGLFLLASEPGSGKTFVLGGAIRELKKAGAKKFTYVTLRTELIGQIKNDLKSYGIDDVEFITYPAMRSGGAKQSDVLIFDEAHSIKNIDESQQAKEAAKWIRKAGFTIFASATPMENPVQAEYLEPTGVFEDLGGFKQFALLFGANIRRIGDQEYIAWERNPLSETDARRSQEYLTKRGLMVSRRIMLPENQVDSRFVKIGVQDSDAARYDALAQAAAENAQQLFGYGRPYIVNLQKRLLEASKVNQAMDEAQAALDRGRFPIIFVETKEKRSIDIPSLIERLDEYNRAVSAAQMMGDEKPQRKDFGLPPAGVVETFAAYMSITGESTIEIPSAESVIRKRFGVGNVAIFTGSVTPAKAQKNLDAWRSGEKPLLVATMAKGGTGLSLHDKVGDHQTTQINVNLPWTATQVVQVTQRSARYGLKGKAEILWLFADNIPFDRMLSARVGGRMADMGASVHGQEIKGASDLLDWNFEERSFAGEYDQDAETSVSPWSGATVEDENRWAGTTVNVSAKGKEESYAGTVVRVLNKGETIEVQREGFDSAIRVPAERVSVIDLVDSKAGSSTEQADRAAKILADMESNQEKMRQDKKRREGEKLADWVKAFEGSPREVTAAKDLFRKDFEKARENGVSDDRLIEIIDHGRANDIFTEKEATDLKSRIKPDSVSSGDIESVPIVTEDQIGGGADGTYDQMHSGLASKLVQQKIALGMKGIDGREYGIFEHSEGKWQLVSRPMVKPEPTPKQRHELLLDRAAPYVEKGESYKRDIADPAVRLQMAIAKGNAIDSSLVQTLTDELEVRLDYWEPILQKAKEENEARDQEDEERPDTGTVGQDRRAISEYGVKGKSASVITADKSTRRATYYAVEADSLIPSHDARKNFAKNEGSLENERPYEDPKEGADSRQTVRGIAEVDKEKRYLLTSDTMSPTDGPPIVDLYGRVLGGNARSMGMQLAYAGPNADVLRSHMRAEGAKFEIPQEQLDALNNPVIIRVMEEPFDENTISSLLNESLAAAKSQATVVVSQSKRLSEETIDLVASILGAETEPSLREVMANPRQSTRIVQAIVRDGAWSDKDIAVYVDPGTGDLTAEGKLAIENMLVARVIPNVSLLGDVAPAVKQKILSAIGPLTKGLASEKFGKQMLGDLVAAIEAYDGYIAERKTNSLQSYFFEQKQMFPVPGHGSVTVAGIVHALADFTPTKFRNAMRDVVESLGIGERTPSLFGDDVTYDTIEDAVRNVINPPLRKDNDLLMQLDDRITDPPQSLFQSDPDIDATIRSKALDLGIAANEAGITAFDDFVRYSLKRNGEKLTRYMGAYLAMVGKTVGMTGIRPVKDILGVPMTPAEYVQLGKEAFAGSPQVTPEQVEAGIEAAMLTGLPQMAVGFAPAGSPVPGRKTREVLTQGDFDQPADYEFTESDYRPAVVSYARDKWGDAMASNGKPTWQNFVRWFGGSEVVDKDGKPLVVYHGTAKTFDKFYQKDDTKSPSKLIGFFFSPSAKMASDHIARRSGGEPGSQIYPTYLSVKNPYVESVMDHMDMNVWSAAKIKKWKQSLIDEGYDGVYIKPSKSMPGYEDGVWVAFEPTQIKSATGNRGTFDPNNPNMLYQEEVSASQSQMEQQSSSRISPELEKELDAGEKVTLYRAMMLIDGKLYPPMSGKVADDSGKVKTRDPETIGKWMRSEERPDLIAKSGRNAGKFKLEKAGGDGSDVWVVYAPYFHASPMPLNDQFSAAWLNDGISRPQLVTVEIEVPKSELTSGYQAQNSPKKVGANKWQSGVVASKIPGGRDVVLSRYARIKRIVPDAEVAKKIAEIVNPARLSVPENTVTPQLRAELEKNGVRISPQGTSGDDVFYQQETQLSVVHNLSAESLVFADKMGGLAVPSLAVVRADMGLEGVSHYGEITLIGTRELADPQIVETYDADAYTPTFPKPEYRTVKRSVAQSLVNQLRPWSEKFASRSAMDAAWDNAVNKANPQDTVYQFLNSNSVKGWFLQEIGIQADPVKSAVKPRWDWAHSKAWVQRRSRSF